LVLADVFLVMMGVQVIDKMQISHQCHGPAFTFIN
jgi:hypothetical protein